MPKFFYNAKSLSGERRSGVLEAKDKQELSKILWKERFVLVSAQEEGTDIKKGGLKNIRIPFLNRISLLEKIMFTRNLGIMISAGLALPQSLEILAIQTKSKKFKTALLKIKEEIIKGKSFSETLSKYPSIFSELFRSMIKVGEESGTLEKVLEVLSRQMEREYNLKSKVKSAMIYPAVIVLTMLGIGTVMLIVVVPKLAQTFTELGVELPFTTRLVIYVGNFLANFWYLLPLIILFFLILLKLFLKSKIGKLTADTFVLKIPIVSSIIKKTNSAYTVRTLSSLISSGVPIVRSLEIISEALGNFYYKKALSDAAKRVGKGGKLGEVLEYYQDIYPVLVIQMIKVGEETGETADILAKLADFFEEEVANTTKNLSVVIEPFLMLLIGGAIGFFAISMVQPMYSMLQAF